MKHEREKVIERPRDDVAKLYADRSRIKEWHPSVADYKHLSDELGQPDAKAEIVLKHGITIVETVTGRGRGDPPGSFSHTDEEKRCLATFVNTFEELTPGSTRWTVTAEFIFTGNWIEREIMKRVMSKEICKYMEAFKEFAEGEL